MSKGLKIIVAVPAALFILLGLRWLVDPAGAAATLGMPLLEGMGLSTQVGDIGALFTASGAMIFIGIATQRREWFAAVASLMACTAIFRTVAWLAHGAALAIPEIAVEVVLAGLLLFAASRAGQHGGR